MKRSIAAKIKAEITVLKKKKTKTNADYSAIDKGIEGLTVLSYNVGDFIDLRDITKLTKSYSA